MIEVRFYDHADDSLLKFAALIAKSEGKWIFCRHRDRSTLELPGGHREAGEDIGAAAERELREETGAVSFAIRPICVYSVIRSENAGEARAETFGMLYVAEVEFFEAELLTGDIVTNQNRSANMRKSSFYVCPICGNVIQAVGEGAFCCCGIALPKLEAEEHYISFFAYTSSSGMQFVKLYPEQAAECRFSRRGHGSIYAYCNRHGLYEMRV